MIARIVNFPQVIEPLVHRIEVQIARGKTAAEAAIATPRHTVLYRVQGDEPMPHVVDLGADPMHLFCTDSEGRLSESTLGLAYSPLGWISHTLQLHKQTRPSEWQAHRIPEEVAGVSAIRPSCRLLFRTDEDRDRFVAAITRKLASIGPDGGSPTFSGSIAGLLAIRCTDVAE